MQRKSLATKNSKERKEEFCRQNHFLRKKFNVRMREDLVMAESF